MTQPNFTIRPARREEAAHIASLIMTAMNDECCQYFAGPEHTLEDFHKLITSLVERTDSQYSYLNALVAADPENNVVGVLVGYDGARLHELRRAFVDACKEAFDRDFSNIPDETQAGEFYLDSLAVEERMRGHGVASALLRAAIEKHGKQQPVGLLVDKGNPKAEALYLRLGFVYQNDNEWGGHPMKHLVARAKN
ncbi:MAG: GNAT family N-acetyltransferase [Prevotella sp.]|jgi:ribosomal protein S18 acetylase RimI-like enzyme